MTDDTVARGDGQAALQWDGHADALLKDWRQRMAAASEAHYKLASGLRRKNLVLGVPVVIFSSIVGTSLFATLADPKAAIPPMFKITIGSISVAAAILAALQTFLRFGERAEKHVVAADWYAAVRRDVDQVLALSAEERGKPKECFDRVRKEMSKIGQQSPEIGDRMWKVMAAKYGVDTALPRGGPS
ncbi:MAG: SLATT domain-containing protein [Gammaproteobacteria bacterium]